MRKKRIVNKQEPKLLKQALLIMGENYEKNILLIAVFRFYLGIFC